MKIRFYTVTSLEKLGQTLFHMKSFINEKSSLHIPIQDRENFQSNIELRKTFQEKDKL